MLRQMWRAIDAARTRQFLAASALAQLSEHNADAEDDAENDELLEEIQQQIPQAQNFDEDDDLLQELQRQIQ